MLFGRWLKHRGIKILIALARGQPKVESEAVPIREVETRSPEETIAFGRDLAKELQPPCLVLIEGELGSGKTTLVKGLVAGLGAGREEEVTSPSFTLVHEYGGAHKVYHVDLYRVETEAELATLGLEELLGPPFAQGAGPGRGMSLVPSACDGG